MEDPGTHIGIALIQDTEPCPLQEEVGCHGRAGGLRVVPLPSGLVRHLPEHSHIAVYIPLHGLGQLSGNPSHFLPESVMPRSKVAGDIHKSGGEPAQGPKPGILAPAVRAAPEGFPAGIPAVAV